MIDELKQIRENLLRAIENKDLLYAKMQVNRLDTYIYKYTINNKKKIWVHKIDKRWWTYWKPKWLNSISWEKGQDKIYRWLWWGYINN